MRSAASVLVEELLEGPEVSVFAICDGADAIPLAAAQDFKRAYDGDEGPNTGGMGSYAPVPGLGQTELEDVLESVHRPVLDELQRRGTPFVGLLYAGLMLTPDGPRVLEFNCRFGDPETQSVLPLLDGDLTELLAAAAEGELQGVQVEWRARRCRIGRHGLERIPGHEAVVGSRSRAATTRRRPARSSSMRALRCGESGWSRAAAACSPSPASAPRSPKRERRRTTGVGSDRVRGRWARRDIALGGDRGSRLHAARVTSIRAPDSEGPPRASSHFEPNEKTRTNGERIVPRVHRRVRAPAL